MSASRLAARMAQWDDLKPDDLGDELLCSWAIWHRDGHGGSSTCEGYLRERLDHAHDGIPPDDVRTTEKILARLKVQDWFRWHWKFVKHYYLGGKSIEETYRDMERTEGFTRLLWRQVTSMVSERYQGLTIDYEPLK